MMFPSELHCAIEWPTIRFIHIVSTWVDTIESYKFDTNVKVRQCNTPATLIDLVCVGGR